jgi:glycosyltransferase involved in cell wall biosynthesis
MKIAFISDAVYPYHIGGKETRLFDLTTRLAKKGHDVHIYSMKWWNGPKTIKENGVYLHGICKQYPLYKGKSRSIKQGVMFGLACFKLLKEDFDVIDADHMVYFHLFPVKLACMLKGKKMVVTWNEVWGKEYWKNYMGNKGLIGYWMEKMSSKLPNKIISISNHTTNNLIKSLGVSGKKITTLDIGIDLDKIQKIVPSKEKIDVTFAGRFLSHKNINLLIQAVKIISKKNPKIKVTIVGDGPERENLEKLVMDLKLEKNIGFTGFLENIDDVTKLIKSSKVFVLPSSREGFGIVVIQANACGVPVVTINHKDNASKDLIVSGKNGFVCDFDEKCLADNINKAIKLSKSMEKGCIKQAERFDWDNLIKQFEEVYTG